MEEILKLKYDIEQMQKGMMNPNTSKKHKLELWESYSTKSFKLSTKLLKGIYNGNYNTLK